MNNIIMFFAFALAITSTNGMDKDKVEEKIPFSLQKEGQLFGELYEIAEENLQLKNQLFQSFVEINKIQMLINYLQKENQKFKKENEELSVNFLNSERECHDLRMLVQMHYQEAKSARTKNELLQNENCELKKLLEKKESEKK